MEQKMSKSDVSDLSEINLNDTKDEILNKKLKKPKQTLRQYLRKKRI